MKLAEVFRYELEHRLGSRSTWIYALLMFGFAVANAADIGDVGAVNANAPRAIAFNSVLVGLFGIAVSIALFGDAALRDIEAGMDPLLFTSPVRKIDYLGGRYLAAFVANAMLLLAVPLGFAVPALLGYPDPAAFGPLRIGALLQPWLVCLLPNMALTGAVLFTVALLSRRLVPVYVCGLVLFMGCLITGDPAFALPAFDPAGLATLTRITRDWSAEELNSRLVTVTAGLVWNRLLWLTVTAGVLLLLQRRFEFAHAVRSGGARRTQSDAAADPRDVGAALMRVTPSFGSRTAVQHVVAVARNSLREIVCNRWFTIVWIAAALWCATLVEKTTLRPFDTTTWPATMLVTAVLSTDFLVGVYLLVGLYASELVWKDRDVGVADIVDVTPVADGAALAGRLVALIAIGAMFLAASMVGGMIGQVAHDYYTVEPLLYARVLFGMNLPEVALMAVLAMTVHVVVNHKYIGIMVMLVTLIIPFTGHLLGHYLLVYNGDAGWTYSDINGFGPFLAPFLWLKLYSAGWAILLAVVASLLWVRGRETETRHRLLQARARFSGPLRGAAGAALALTLMVGGFIFLNTNVLNAFDPARERNAQQAEYEKRYSRFASIPQPRIELARVRTELYPAELRVDLSGEFQLVNRTGTPIDSIHVSSRAGMSTRSISFSRDATPVLSDTALGYRIFALAQSLAPGDSIRMSFDVQFRQRGFLNSGFQTDVVANGTYIGRSWLPMIGFQPGREQSAFTVRDEGLVRVDATIGTVTDQVAITSGALRQEWFENGRRYFRYETETPQPFDAVVISGRYAVHTDRWMDSSGASKREVTLSVYHHPRHDRNLDTFIRSMKASLENQRTQNGPYDASDLRVVEVPRYHREFRAYPGLLVFSEGRFIANTQTSR